MNKIRICVLSEIYMCVEWGVKGNRTGNNQLHFNKKNKKIMQIFYSFLFKTGKDNVPYKSDYDMVTNTISN